MFNSIKLFVEKIKSENIFSWINNKSNEIKGIILSPDTDGFISGLFLNEVFRWKVVGFYDGKSLIVVKNVNFRENKEEYIFIDVEILRPYIKSAGHHILVWDQNEIPSLITSVSNVCLQPNIWRGMDVKNKFATKYPFGIFHLLISIVYFLDPKNKALNFNPTKAIIPSIYINGVFKNLFNYPENCLEWLKYMTDDDPNHPFEKLLNHPSSPKDIMILMEQFFGVLNNIWTTQQKEGKGKIKPLDKNISSSHGSLRLNQNIAIDLQQYLDYLSKQYDWKFDLSLWPVITSDLEKFTFNKQILPATKSNYLKAISRNPISLAITSKARKGLEFTEDISNVFNQ
jgi:hypothetical protein